MNSIATPPAARVRHFPRIAPDRALSQAEAADRRVRSRSAPVRSTFVGSRDSTVPPLAQILRGGRGGEVRLKLFLTALWMAGNPPFDVTFPYRAWAELVGLPDPERNGARRIADALKSLQALHLVTVRREGQQAPTITLLDDGGRGSSYREPWKARERYLQLRSQLWTKGWVAVLSGRALALLLILLDQRDSRKPLKRIWLAPRIAEEIYSLSADTRTRAAKELRSYGIINVIRQPVREDFGWTRVRNSYRLGLSRLETAPDAPHTVIDVFGQES